MHRSAIKDTDKINKAKLNRMSKKKQYIYIK